MAAILGSPAGAAPPQQIVSISEKTGLSPKAEDSPTCQPTTPSKVVGGLPSLAVQAFQIAHQGMSSEVFDKFGALDDEDNHAVFVNRLPPKRQKVALFLSSMAFEISLSLVILVNLIVAILETDATVDDPHATPLSLTVMNIGLLCIYCIEMVVRLYAYQCHYFKSSWNILDFTVISLDLVLHLLKTTVGDLPNVSVLRTVRLIRLARAVRILVLFPELYMIIQGMAGTVKTVFWGLLLLGGFTVFFALIAVQMIHPINKDLVYDGCDRCSNAFGSVWEATCTFTQQIVAGDSWGLVSLPIIEAEPWTFFFFLLVLVTINLLVINLILAVVVQKAQDAQTEELRKKVEREVAEKEAMVKKSQGELVKLCYQMDEDKSGNLSLDELLNGYDSDAYFANLLKSMDITRDDIKIIFNIMDQDNSGDIDYVEFVDQLHRLKSQDQHTLLIFILYYVKELQVAMQQGGGGGGSPKMEKKMSRKSSASTTPQKLGGGPQDDDPASQMARLGAMVREAQEATNAQVDRMAAITAAFERLERISPLDNRARGVKLQQATPDRAVHADDGVDIKFV